MLRIRQQRKPLKPKQQQGKKLLDKEPKLWLPKILKLLRNEKLSMPQFNLVLPNKLLELLKSTFPFKLQARSAPNKKLVKLRFNPDSLAQIKPKCK